MDLFSGGPKKVVFSSQSTIHVRNKVAVITGAAGGIGAACAFTLADNGAYVVLTDISEHRSRALKIVENISNMGGKAEFMALDVTIEDQWQKVINHVVGSHDGLDILVNNAGISFARPLLETSLKDWRNVHAVNLESVFLGTRAAMEAMRPEGGSGRGGSIVNISSVGGIVGASGLSAYCSAKAGVRLFSKCAAIECGQGNYGIRVNSVHPGNTLTPMFQAELEDMRDQGMVGSVDQAMKFYMDMQVLPEIGQPEDIASMVLFLASDAARFVTGGEFVVDGGLTAQ